VRPQFPKARILTETGICTEGAFGRWAFLTEATEADSEDPEKKDFLRALCANSVNSV
jgi:hypothetical protein